MAKGERQHRSQHLFVARGDGGTHPPVHERTLLEAALAFSSAMVAVLDQDGRVLQIAATRDKLHWLGTGIFEHLHAAGHDALQRQLEHAIAADTAGELEARAVAEEDGASCWYRIALEPVSGQPLALAILTVIDRQRQTRIENKRFRAILDQADEAIFVVDPRTTKFVDVNDTACRMLRFTRAELLALGPKDIEVDFPLHTREQWIDYMLEVMAVGTLPYEGVHRRKNGSTYPVEATWSIKTFEGDEYLLGVCRDISEQRQIQADLHQAEETLRVSDRLTTVGTLAAGIVHEINNPLSYVMGNVEYALDRLSETREAMPDGLADELLDALGEANQGASRMSGIVRDLRTFSRRDDDSVGAVAVAQVIDSSINIAMNEIRQRACIERDYSDDMLVMANEPRLGQVFLNLLINAAQAIKPGDSTNQFIRVHATRDRDAGITVRISDTGSGMSQEVLARVFDPFFTTKPIGVGTGLGLSICRNIIESFGGRIEVESTLDVGTTFRIWLPAATRQPDGRVRVKTADLVSAGTGSSRRAQVLIIDDDVLAAKALRRHLAGHRGEIELDGRGGLERFTSGQFDVAFCEIRMPDFGGIAFYEVIAAHHPELLPRLVLVRSGPLEQRLEEFIAEHHIEVTSKPYDVEEIRGLIEQRLLLASS